MHKRSYRSPLDDWTEFYQALSEAMGSNYEYQQIHQEVIGDQLRNIDCRMNRMAGLIKKQKQDTREIFNNFKQEEDDDLDFDFDFESDHDREHRDPSYDAWETPRAPNSPRPTQRAHYAQWTTPKTHHTKTEDDDEDGDRYEKLVLKMMMGDLITNLNEINLDPNVRAKINTIYLERLSKVKNVKMHRNIIESKRCTSLTKTGIRCKNPICAFEPWETKCYIHFTDEQKERYRRAKVAKFCEKHEDIVHEFV